MKCTFEFSACVSPSINLPRENYSASGLKSDEANDAGLSIYLFDSSIK